MVHFLSQIIPLSQQAPVDGTELTRVSSYIFKANNDTSTGPSHEILSSMFTKLNFNSI